jgi:hypothetical protein
MQTILFAAAIALAALAAPFAVCAPSPEARYEAAAKVLSDCKDCDFDIDDKAEHLKALDDMWTATEGWMVDYLNAHPRVTAEKLRTVFLNADPGYQPLPAAGHLVYVAQHAAPDGVIRLAPDLFGFESGGSFGNVFLVAKRDDRFQVVWDIRSLSAGEVSKFPVLTSWSASHARESCRANDDVRDQCGPIGGAFKLLPPDTDGHTRFYLDATYTTMMGETVGGQISIWSWDGNAATPLLARSYTYDLEDVSVTLSHGLLKVRAKEEYQSYYSCGACLGRRMDWTIRIEPDRVVDLGMKPLNPELDTVDALFRRVEKHEAADDLASPRAVSKLANIIAPMWDDAAQPPEFDLGIIDYSSVDRTHGRAVACISVDEIDNGLSFTLEKRNGKNFITDIALVPPHKSGKC